MEGACYLLASAAAGAGTHCAGAGRPSPPRSGRRVDRILLPSALWSCLGGSRGPTAARWHPCRIDRSPVDAGAVSAPRRGRRIGAARPALDPDDGGFVRTRRRVSFTGVRDERTRRRDPAATPLGVDT